LLFPEQSPQAQGEIKKRKRNLQSPIKNEAEIVEKNKNLISGREQVEIKKKSEN
jgi:hypothetical protein